MYPRSLDYDVVSTLVQLAAGPSSLAKTIRLMAGNELVTEGFQPGQVGSTRDAAQDEHPQRRAHQRVHGASCAGYASMAGELAGDQWNEGDVSESVVRRVALPDAFFALDGLFETTLTVLDEFGAFPAVIARELDRYLPFLATTKVLMAAVQRGAGREQAHEVIKENAVSVALEMREKGSDGNDLFARLAADSRLGLSATELDGLLAEPIAFTGAARAQVAAVVTAVNARARVRPGRRDLSTRADPVTRSILMSRSSSTHLHSGKVRDLYSTPDGRLVMVASDRISAFDFILPTLIPDKGAILTALTEWWFERLADIVPNHLISTTDPVIPAQWRGRAMLCEQLDMVPVEAVARGYLTGSGLLDYARDRRGLRRRAAARPASTATGCPSRSSRRRPRPRSASTTRTCRTTRWRRPSARRRRAELKTLTLAIYARASEIAARARHPAGRHQVRVRPRRRPARWCWPTRCSPRTRRGSGRPTTGRPGGRSRASTSSTCATGCSHRRPAGTAPAARPRRRCPTMSSSRPAPATSRPTSA